MINTELELLEEPKVRAINNWLMMPEAALFLRSLTDESDGAMIDYAKETIESEEFPNKDVTAAALLAKARELKEFVENFSRYATTGKWYNLKVTTT
jgi:hypothetical protein